MAYVLSGTRGRSSVSVGVGAPGRSGITQRVLFSSHPSLSWVLPCEGFATRGARRSLEAGELYPVSGAVEPFECRVQTDRCH